MSPDILPAAQRLDVEIIVGSQHQNDSAPPIKTLSRYKTPLLASRQARDTSYCIGGGARGKKTSQIWIAVIVCPSAVRFCRHFAKLIDHPL